MITLMDLDFLNKIVKTNQAELRFKYNTNQDYFYFDLFDLDGNVISYHNKVVTGFQFAGFVFTSDSNDSYANASNIAGFKLVTDESV